MQKRVTLSIDGNVYDKFQKFCEDNDVILSKRIERIMREILDKKIKREEK